MTNYKDTDIREALRRKYADTPQMPEDFLNRMRQDLKLRQDQETPHRRIRLPRWVLHVAAGAAVASVLLLLFFFLGEEKTERPSLAKYPTEQPKDSVETTPRKDGEQKTETPDSGTPTLVTPQPVSQEQVIAFTPSQSRPAHEARKTVRPSAAQGIAYRKQNSVTPQPACGEKHEKVKPKPEPADKSTEKDSSATENIAFYIAKLEAEMDALDDSVNAAHIEELIAADTRLQLLVNRIVIGRVGQAWNEMQKDSTANYINF